VLAVDLPWLDDVVRAKRPVRLPVVLADHGTVFREAGVVLPHVTQFFRDATKNTTRS
jgi:hypothetical protein